MQRKESYFSSLEAAPTSDVQARPKSIYEGMFRSPQGDRGEKPKRIDTAGQLTQIPIDHIEELDRSQRLLSSAIILALAVSEARLKAETASIEVRRIVKANSADADVEQWQDLAGKLEEIASFGPWPKEGSDFSKPLLRSMECFYQARDGADKKAHEIVEQLFVPDAVRPEPGHMFGVSQAIAKLRTTLTACAKACDTESQAHVKQIGYRVQSILEQFEGPFEPSNKPTGEKRPGAQEDVRSVPLSVVSDRKLPALGNDPGLKQQNEGSGDPWTGTR